MAVEIERKFLLPRPPEEFSHAPSERIEQGYLAISDDGVEVRVRRVGERTVLTVKQGEGRRRLEEEIDIPVATFEALWPLTEARRVEKERFRLDRDGRRIELDVYTGALDGLVVAEIEFESEEESVQFDAPGWLGREVTGDERYANQRLAVHGMPASEGRALSSEFPDKPLSAKAQRRLAMASARCYRLHEGEEPEEGIRRVARGRVETAVEQLRRDAEADLAKAVHDTRKDLKKLRSLLRLVRDGLGQERYRTENARYRAAARLLSGARDAEVKLETLAGLRERYPGEAPPAERLQRALEEERERLAGRAEDPDVHSRLEEAAEAIEEGGAEVDAWEFRSGGFDLMRPGLEREYGRGRENLRAVRKEPSEAAVHEWRKRVKDLWYHVRLLRDLWPAAMKGAADEAHELSDLLGDHHDLTVLIQEARDQAPEDPDLAILATLAERRQGELLAEALPLGERLYAEKPKQFAGRLAEYWKASRPGDGS